MAFIPLTNGVRVVLELELDGSLIVNVYYVDKASPIITADLTAIATIFRDWWIANQAPLLSDQILLDAVIATDVSIEGGGQVTLTAMLPEQGTLPGAAIANNVAFVVTRYTLFTGRSNRGRSYYAGIPEANILNNTVDAAWVTGFVTAAGQLSLDLQADGYRWIVASYQTGGVPRVTAQAHGVASFAANSRVDTQRRRLPGEGS